MGGSCSLQAPSQHLRVGSPPVLFLDLEFWRARVDFVSFLFGGSLDLLPFGRALVFGSRVGIGAPSRRILVPVAIHDEEGQARCQGDQPAVPILRGRDGARAFLPSPGPNERAYERAYGTCRREARARKRSKRDDAKGSRNSLSLSFHLGFV